MKTIHHPSGRSSGVMHTWARHYDSNGPAWFVAGFGSFTISSYAVVDDFGNLVPVK